MYYQAKPSQYINLNLKINNSRFFLPEILINLEKPIRITRHIAPKNDRYFFWSGITDINSLSILPILLPFTIILFLALTEKLLTKDN